MLVVEGTKDMEKIEAALENLTNVIEEAEAQDSNSGIGNQLNELQSAHQAIKHLTLKGESDKKKVARKLARVLDTMSYILSHENLGQEHFQAVEKIINALGQVMVVTTGG